MRIQPSSPPPSPAPPPPNRAVPAAPPSGTPTPPDVDTNPSQPPSSTPTTPSLPSIPLIDRIKSAQSSLAASNAILRDGEEEPDDARTHRSVGVDPDFYDMVDDNIVAILLDACKPLFDLVSSSPDSKPSTMKHADLIMSTANLIIAAGYKMKEQARQEMAEEDLGGGMFDQDVKDMREAADNAALPQVYDPDEQDVLDTQLAFFNAPPPKALKTYKTRTRLYEAQVAHSSAGFDVRVQMSVRAPVEQVVAWFDGRAILFNQYTTGDGLPLTIGERRNNHSVVSQQLVSMPRPFDDREILAKSLWTKLDDNTFFVAQTSCEHDDFPPQTNRVRVTFKRYFKLTRLGPKLTRLEMIGAADLGGRLPRRVNEMVTSPYTAESQQSLAQYFASVRPADAFDEGDGTVLGQLLFLELHPHRQNLDHLTEKILDMIRTTNVLRSAQAKYRFFDEFLFHIIRNKMKIGASQTSFVVQTPLVALTANEAGRIARSFPMVMMTNATAEAAVDELIITFLALGELDREFVWFRPMVVAVATEHMNAVAWGVKFRAILGAVVSFADMLSDAYVVKMYFDTGRPGSAYGLLGMVGANMVWQGLITFSQTHNLKNARWRTMFSELLAIVMFVKPGLDAFRVASGAEQLPGAAMTPMNEMSFTRAGEMIFEAIPGLVLQIVQLMKTNNKNSSAIFSIIVSTASTALTSTTQFWDNETDPGTRKRNPKWVGLIPDSNRGTAFAAIFFMSGLHALAKAGATALLILADGSWPLYYFVVDHLLFYAYMLARRDMIFFLPMPRTASYILNPVMKSAAKVALDFTGCLNYRLPLLLGGTYTFWTLFTSQVSVLVAVHVYNVYARAKTDQEGVVVDKVEAGVLWAGAAALAVAWSLTVLYFLTTIAVPKYRHTLWSWTSGRKVIQGYFLEGDSDFIKLQIFGCNLLLWEADIGEQVKAWTLANWARWNEEKPDWFTATLIATVPDEYIPPQFLGGLGGANRERRGSAGSVRESFRERMGGVGDEE